MKPATDRGMHGRMLSDEAVTFIREQVGKGILTVGQVVEVTGVGHESIRKMVRGETYRHVALWKKEKVVMVDTGEPGMAELWREREERERKEEERVEKMREEIRAFRAPKPEAPVEYEEEEPAWLKQMKRGRVEG